ncbi:hypothetical protein KEM55_008502 [Ascosphaera atra]|nr:hypothetical protein KEM55_008502 [Ascosphaera atra]
MEFGGTGRRSGTQSKAVSEASSEDESGTPRFSVEQINDVSELEEEDEGKIKGKTPERSIRSALKGLRPERLPREEHVERAVGVNTEAAASRAAQAKKEAKRKAVEEEEDESLFFRSEDDEEDYESEDEVEVTETRHLENKPEAQDETGARVKQEPDTDLTLSDIPPAGQEPAPTAVEKKKKKKSKKKAKAKQLRTQFQTEEERQEYERHTREVDELRRSLGTMMTDDLRTEEKPAEGAEPSEEDKQKQLRREEVEEIQRERQQRLFLVQFPPMTPNLVDPAKRDAETAGGDVREVPAGQVKQENKDGDSPLPSQPTSSNTNPLISATQNRLPAGRAGKLQIHASGRATINWGGIQFELNRGSDVSFLQDVIVMPEQKPVSGSATPSVVGGNTSSREGPPEKSVWAMSQVRNKFVVSPDWEAML